MNGQNLGNINPNSNNNDDIEMLGNTTAIPPIPKVNNGLPETIVTGPVKDFEPPKNSVGELPPKDDGPKKKKEKKVLFVILIIVLILGVAFGVYYYLNMAKKKSLDNQVKTNNLVLELGSSIETDITKYATFNGISSANCVLDTTKIDNKNVGTYDYTITCGTNKYTGKVVVQDTVSPKVTTKDVTASLNETIKPESFIETCDDSTVCSYEFNDENAVKTDLATAGTYIVSIKVKDASGNTVIVNGNLTVTGNSITSYLECTSPVTLQTSYSGTTFSVDKLGFDSSNTFVSSASRIIKYVFLKASDYTSIKQNNENASSYDNISGTLAWDDTNYTLSITNNLPLNTLTSDYGSTFPTDYNTIKSFYENKQYTCENIAK